MNIANDAWFTDHLFGPQDWYPERIGQKRVIYIRPAGTTLLSMAIDPAPAEPSWARLSGRTPCESLFLRLRPFVRTDASIVFLTYPDGAWIELHAHRIISTDEWTPGLLRFFEEVPAKEGGPQMMVVLIRSRRAAVVFYRGGVLEIAYYGPDDLWLEVSACLNGSDD